MENKSNNKAFLMQIISMIMSFVLAVFGLFGIGYGMGLFSSDETIDAGTVEDTADTASEMIIDEGESNGLKLTSATLSTSTTESYVLTVSYNADASNPTFTWTSTDTTNITLTPSEDTISCTVTLVSAFSEQITITCTADDNRESSATCTVDYMSRLTDLSMIFYDSKDSFIEFAGDDDSQTYTLEYYTNYSSSSCISILDYATTLGTGSVTEAYSISCTFTNMFSSINSTALSLSKTITWDALFSRTIGVSITTGASDLYSFFNSYENATEFSISVTARGQTSGYTYTLTYNLTIDASSFYTTTTASGLSQSSIVF